MINQAQRDSIKRYFYGSKGPLLLATVGTFVSLVIAALTKSGGFVMLALLCLIAAGIWSVVEKYIPNPASEQNYDQQVSQDLVDIAVRALEKLGLVAEQVSLIEPIKVQGPYYGYSEYYTEDAKKKFTNRFSFLRALFHYTPKLIFRYGSDEEVRYSMVEVNVFMFTENQVYVYTCGYDACTGDIYEERTMEYFYQDIDCVITGSRVERVIAKKKTYNKRYEYFKLIVTSGTSTYAIADCKVSIMSTQVRGMRELIRNKKEQITL